MTTKTVGLVFETDECPPSTNTYYRNFRGHMVLSQQGRCFKKAMAAKCAGMRKILGPIKVRLDLRFKDKRKRDLDNYFKAIFDAFKDVLYEDDVMIQEIHASKTIGCVSDPGFTLEIIQVAEVSPSSSSSSQSPPSSSSS